MNYRNLLSLIALVYAFSFSATMAIEQPAFIGPKLDGSPRTLTEAERAKAEKYLRAVHNHTASSFGEQMGFGPVRMKGFEPRVLFHWLKEDGKLHKENMNFVVDLNTPVIELLGRIDQLAPVVYENPLPTAKGVQQLMDESMNHQKGKSKKVTPPPAGSLKNALTRALLPTEESALKQLKAGKDLVWEQVGEDVRMVGALTAKKDCAECHATKENALLGALTYRIPIDELLKQLRAIDEREVKR